MAQYLYITEDGYLRQGAAPTAVELAQVDDGSISIIRYNREEFEVASVVFREVDHPGNSFDETRQDQAIDGKIYEIEAWKPLEAFKTEPVPGDANIKAEEALLGPRNEDGSTAPTAPKSTIDEGTATD